MRGDCSVIDPYHRCWPLTADKRRGPISWLFALVVLACTPLPSWAAEAARIRASYASFSPASALLGLTQEAGHFRRENLDVEVLYVPAGSLNVQALMAKEIHLSTLGGPAVVQAGLQGADLVFIASMANRLMVSLVAEPSIKNVASLKNKRVGITRFGSNIDLQARVLLNQLGVSPRDTTFIQLGGDAERMAALKSGLVEASFFSPEMLGRARQEGLSVLFDPKKQAPIPWLQTGVVISRDLIVNRRGQVRSMARALFNGMNTFRTNSEFTLNFLTRFQRQSDRGRVQDVYDEYNTQFPWPPYPTREGLSYILEQLSKSSSKKADDFIDTSFIKEMESQGFFRK
jgi:ABC-type nitrate/sulfonate/bicarbonate transport system substrate-binding protein